MEKDLKEVFDSLAEDLRIKYSEKEIAEIKQQAVLAKAIRIIEGGSHGRLFPRTLFKET